MATETGWKIEVLHVVGGNNLLGGVNSFVVNLAGSPIHEVRQSVWKHRSFCPPPGSAVNWTCESTAKRTDVSALRDLVGAVRDVSPLCSWTRHHSNSVLYAHSRMGMLSAALASRLTRKPLLMHMHARASRPELYRRIWRSSRATVLFNSRRTCRHYGCDPDTSLVFMPPITWPATHLLEKAEPSVVPRFVSAGMFVPWKNTHVIVEAFKQMETGAERGALLLYGNSPELDSTYQRSIMQGASGHAIQFMG